TGASVSSDPAPRSTTDSTSSARVTVPGVLDLVVGMGVTGASILPNTTITAINRNTNTITLSTTPTASVADTLTFSGVVARTLTLTGTNTGANVMGNLLGDSPAGGALSVNKTGSGTWSLTNTNTYSGPTTISGGIL